jgi:uncharacterized membrane protein YedE/YeeE
MTIDWAHFTPWSSLAGGALIGLAAALLIVLNGRVAGISGILGGLFGRSREGVGERLLFVLGLLLAPLAWQLFSELPPIEFTVGWQGLLAAGLLVGIGTRYGAGCTSGHGVCGLSRLSVRSLAATLLFMGAGFMTVFVVRHVLGN